MFNPDDPKNYSSGEKDEVVKSEVKEIKKIVETNAERVAKLGEWPSHIEPGSLLERIPSETDTNAPGFDAGTACAMDLIPREMQELSAKLHANYSKESVLQVLEEIKANNPNSETIWWLAACYYCDEGGVDQKKFVEQVNSFKKTAVNPQDRSDKAKEEYKKMTSSFELKDGVPFADKNGGIQGAYIAGYTYGVEYSAKYGIYFIGTYEPSLGLEDFQWSEEKDEKNRPKSGPVFGSKQFVKCSSEEELKKALEVIKNNLPLRQEKE